MVRGRMDEPTAACRMMLKESILSAVEKVDVRLIQDTQLLHGLSQIRGLGERLRAVEVLCLKKKDDFIRVLSAPKKMLLGEARLRAFGKMSVIAA